jgi:LacI family transcriptional regulator
VLQAARELGYTFTGPTRSNAGRRAAKVRLTHVAALFVSRDPETAAGQGVVKTALYEGLSAAAKEHFATVHLCVMLHDEVDSLQLSAHWPPVLRDGIIEGLVLHGDVPARAVEVLLRRFNLVSIINRSPVPVDCIDHDDQAGARQLVRHLVERGHRSIGFVGMSFHPGQSWHRQTGYIEGLLEAGLTYEKDLVFQSDTDFQAGDELSGRIVAAARNGVTAFVCGHDGIGYRLGMLLLKAGLSVPQDVSLCGFDDLPPPVPDVPKLTTIAAPFQRIGAAALERLIARLAAPKMEPVRIVYPCVLREGDSVARIR